MSGAAEAGGVLERAQLALQAGCDLILLCNNRTATETLLSRLTWNVEPVTQVRLMRMHGKGRIIDFEELQNELNLTDGWIRYDNSAERIEIPLSLAENLAEHLDVAVVMVEIHPTHDRLEVGMVHLNAHR